MAFGPRAGLPQLASRERRTRRECPAPGVLRIKRLLLILLLAALAWHWWPVYAPAVANPPPLADLPAADPLATPVQPAQGWAKRSVPTRTPRQSPHAAHRKVHQPA